MQHPNQSLTFNHFDFQQPYCITRNGASFEPSDDTNCTPENATQGMHNRSAENATLPHNKNTEFITTIPNPNYCDTYSQATRITPNTSCSAPFCDCDTSMCQDCSCSEDCFSDSSETDSEFDSSEQGKAIFVKGGEASRCFIGSLLLRSGLFSNQHLSTFKHR